MFVEYRYFRKKCRLYLSEKNGVTWSWKKFYYSSIADYNCWASLIHFQHAEVFSTTLDKRIRANNTKRFSMIVKLIIEDFSLKKYWRIWQFGASSALMVC